MWWIATELCWKRLCGDSFATSRAVHLFPQMLKMDFQRSRWKSIFARWGRTPNPVTSPVAGAGYAFGNRTLLSLLRRDRRGFRPLESRRSGRHGLAGKRKTGLVCTSARYRIAARLARDCLDNSQISSRRFCKSSMSAA